MLSHVQLFETPWTCSLPGSSAHGILQARILEWVAFSFSRGSNPGLPHCRRIHYHLSHQGSQWLLNEVVSASPISEKREKLWKFPKCPVEGSASPLRKATVKTTQAEALCFLEVPRSGYYIFLSQNKLEKQELLFPF